MVNATVYLPLLCPILNRWLLLFDLKHWNYCLHCIKQEQTLSLVCLLPQRTPSLASLHTRIYPPLIAKHPCCLKSASNTIHILYRNTFDALQ